MITNEEKQEIIAAVVSVLRSSSVRIADLPRVENIPEGSLMELSGGKSISLERVKDIISDSMIGKPDFLTNELMSHYRGRRCKLGGLIKNRPNTNTVSLALSEDLLSEMKELGMDYIITSFYGASIKQDGVEVGTTGADNVDKFLETLSHADEVGIEVYQSYNLFVDGFDEVVLDAQGFTTDYKQSLTKALLHPSFKGIWVDEPLPYSNHWVQVKDGNGVKRWTWVANPSIHIRRTDGILQYADIVRDYFSQAGRTDVKLDVNLLAGHSDKTWNESSDEVVHEKIDSNNKVTTYGNHAFFDTVVIGGSTRHYNYQGSYEKYIRDYLKASDTVSADYYPVKRGVQYDYSTKLATFLDDLYRTEARQSLLGEWALGFNYLLNAHHAHPDKDYKCFVMTTELDHTAIENDGESDYRVVKKWDSWPIMTTKSLAVQCYCALIMGVSNISYFCLADCHLHNLNSDYNPSDVDSEKWKYHNSPYQSEEYGFAHGSTWDLVDEFNHGKFAVLKDFIASKYIYGIDVYAWIGKRNNPLDGSGSFQCANMQDQPNLHKIDKMIPDFISSFTETSRFMVSVGYDDEAEYLFIVNLNFVNQDDERTNYEGLEVESGLVITPSTKYDVRQVNVNEFNSNISYDVPNGPIVVDPCDICILRIAYEDKMDKEPGPAAGGTYDEKTHALQLHDKNGNSIGDAIEMEYEALKGFQNKLNKGSWDSGDSHGAYSIERHCYDLTEKKEKIGSHAYGDFSVAIGKGSKAYGQGSYAEGWGTRAKGDYSHAENADNEASGLESHAGGTKCYASDQASFAHGIYLKSRQRGGAVFGYGNMPLYVMNTEKITNKLASAMGENGYISSELQKIDFIEDLAETMSDEDYITYINDELDTTAINNATTAQKVAWIADAMSGSSPSFTVANVKTIVEKYTHKTTTLFAVGGGQLFSGGVRRRKNVFDVKSNGDVYFTGDVYIPYGDGWVKLQDLIIELQQGTTPTEISAETYGVQRDDAPEPIEVVIDELPDDDDLYYGEIGDWDDDDDFSEDYVEPVWVDVMTDPESEIEPYYGEIGDWDDDGGDDNTEQNEPNE